MEFPTVPTTLATMTLYKPLPTSTSSPSDLPSLPLSTQSASLHSQVLPNSAPSVSISSSLSFSSAPLSSSSTTFSPPIATSSLAEMTSNQLSPTFSASSSSSGSNKSVAFPIIWIAVVVAVLSIALAIFAFGVYNSRRKLQSVEAELALAPQNTLRPWSSMDVTPGLIRRTTTSRLREDWQQWIAKPPPLRRDLRRRDSAVLFGTGSGSRLSSEPLLTAQEVEVSGVLESTTNIPDPPPAYTPRRF